MQKKVLVAIPPTMLEEIDYVSKTEHRSRSDLIREALRRYLENFRKKEATWPPRELDLDSVPDLAL